MSAFRLYPFPPIVGQWRGFFCTLIEWRNGGRVLVRFDHDQRVREVWRRDMNLFDWQRPHYRRLAVKPRQSPPPITRHDDGGLNPMAA